MKIRVIPILLALISLASCIKNDLDYPRIVAEITELEVEGQKSVIIDTDNRTVVIDLLEETDERQLRVISFACSDEVTNSADMPETLDLSTPFKLRLKTYQDYEWTISAKKDIERYVRCDNQSAKPVINAENKTILLYVSEEQKLTHINFTSIKLGPIGSKIVSTTGYSEGGIKTQPCEFPMVLDCVIERSFDVEYRGETSTWSLNAIQVSAQMAIKSVEPWARKAVIEASFAGAGTPVIEYKKIEDANWQTCSDIDIDGSNIIAQLSGLSSNTEYEARVSVDGNLSSSSTFQTEEELQLANSNFDQWYLDGKIWNPFSAAELNPIWDTANKAVANWKNSISVPEDNFIAVAGEGKKAAKLESTYAVVKFASASMFCGNYVKLNGLGAELSWGVPFESKPTALHGYYCYKPQIVNYADKDHQDMMGNTDIGQIQVILTDWDEPFRVISTTQQFVDVDKDPHIIAYANLLIDEENEGYVEFTLPLEYRQVRKPKYIVVCMASSRYGDFFTGGVGSTLYVDEFELEYL